MVTRALLLACLPTVGCGLIANLGDVHFDPSDTGVAPTDTSLGDTFTTDTSLGDTFVSDTFVLPSFTHTFAAGHAIELKVVVNNTGSGDDMWLAYGTAAYPAKVIGP